MSHFTVSHSLQRTLKTTFEVAYQQTLIALKAAGFRIVSEVDLGALLAKDGSNNHPCHVLVVYKADIAHRAAAVAPQVSVALLCNVAISQLSEELIEVQSTDPLVTWSEIPVSFLKPIAEDLHEQLRRVIDAVSG